MLGHKYYTTYGWNNKWDHEVLTELFLYQERIMHWSFCMLGYKKMYEFLLLVVTSPWSADAQNSLVTKELINTITQHTVEKGTQLEVTIELDPCILLIHSSVSQSRIPVWQKMTKELTGQVWLTVLLSPSTRLLPSITPEQSPESRYLPPVWKFFNMIY